MRKFTPANFPSPQDEITEARFLVDASGYPFKELMRCAEDHGWIWGNDKKPTAFAPGWVGTKIGTIILNKHIYQSDTNYSINATFLTSEKAFAPTVSYFAKCPVCGSDGNDLLFAFYCSRAGCQNYRG